MFLSPTLKFAMFYANFDHFQVSGSKPVFQQNKRPKKNGMYTKEASNKRKYLLNAKKI